MTTELYHRHRILTIPNFMTLMRLLFLIPIFWCLAHQLRWWVLFWGLLGIITDLMDGWVARKFNQSSDLGRLMDPVVDKINVISVTFFMVLSPYYGFPVEYFLFMVVRELSVMTGGLIVTKKKHVILESNVWGKRSAFVTGCMVILFILDWRFYAWILLWISLGLTLVSTWVYARLFIERIKRK
ncbi:CDP-alcohol phosphatidyltransferase family protein [bacterium]|nr:CDP-alcohol phosphatidyltransferase family protein [bacterium]